MKGLAAQWPEPGRLWIRFRFREWPGPAGPWTNLATGEPGESYPEAALPALPEEGAGEVDDLLYLPPVAATRRTERDAFALAWLDLGVPLLVQLLPDEAPPEYAALFVYDLLPALASGDLAALAALPAGSHAVWPLVAGLTDTPELLDRGLSRLCEAEVTTLQPVAISLDPNAARRLAEGHSEEVFHALFHREARSLREVARLVHAAGMSPWIPRPPAPGTPARAGNRALAGELAFAAELALELGRPVGWGLGLLRAARWIDAAPYDVAALAREGNLGVVPEVDSASRALATEWAASGRLAVLAELKEEYLGP